MVNRGLSLNKEKKSHFASTYSRLLSIIVHVYISVGPILYTLVIYF